MKLVIFGEPELISAIHSAAPDSVVTDRSDDDALGLELLPSITLAIGHFVAMSKAIYTKLVPFINARPEMEIEIKGPSGAIKLKMKNVTEQLIAETAMKVMSEGRHTRRRK